MKMKRDFSKKLLSMLLCFIMIVGIFPAYISAKAADMTAAAVFNTASDVTGSVSTGSAADEKIIWDYLMSKIGNKYGVAGLMGNLYAESALRSNNLQNKFEERLGYTDDTYTAAVDDGSYTNFVHDSAGYGLAQWTHYSRKQKLLNYVKARNVSIGDFNTQLEFLYKELSESFVPVLNALKNATSVESASYSVLTEFERPADQSEAVQKKRASYGQVYYDKYANASPSEPETVDVTVGVMWDGSETLNRPESVTVQLYRDGKAYGGAAALNEANGWTNTWTGLETDSNGDWQIDFAIVTDEGYEIELVTVGGVYKSIEDVSEDEGIANLYRITRIESDITVTVKVKRCFPLGDVNGDGEVDNLDAVIILQYDAGIVSDVERGDVNGDGTTDNLDAALILMYDAGIINNFD